MIIVNLQLYFYKMCDIRDIIQHGNLVDLKRALDDGMTPDIYDLAQCRDSRQMKLLFRKNSFIIHSYVKKYVPWGIKLKLLLYYGANNDSLSIYNSYLNRDIIMSYYPEY